MRTTYQRGQVYPLFALLLVSFIGLSGLAIDLGYWRYQERVQQTATDSAAIAAAQASVFPSPNAANAAYADAAGNGYPTPAASVSTVTDYTDAYTGNSASAVQVTISKSYPKFFSSFFGGSSQAIATTAVAKLAEDGNGCLTGLDPNGNMTLNGEKFAGSGCSINSNGALSCNGGNYTVIQGITVNSSNNSSVSCKGGPATNYTTIIPDPCPYVTGCLAYQEASAATLGITCLPGSSGCTPSCLNPQTVPTSGGLAPSGCYNGATFSNATVFSGQYVFVNGATFSNNMTTSSSGASFYIASGALNLASQNLGSSTTAFSGPSSGTYAGILFYQPAANTSNLTVAANIWSQGMYYFPSVTYTTNGHPIHQYTGDLVFASYKFNGGNTTTLFPGASGSTFAIQQAVLAE